jgi:hypothetical protein
MGGMSQGGQRNRSRAPAAKATRCNFLSAVALGGSLAVLGTGVLDPSPKTARALPAAAEGTDALLLNCMDYRLVDDVTHYMDGRGMSDKYDQVILAGASLGVASDKFPAWAETFWQHLDIAIQLHHVHQVIALDHRDCGAYKVALGQDFAKYPEAELAVHTQHLLQFRELVKLKQPALEVELLLMALDGSVEVIG